MSTFAVVTGGGTAGHVYPALAVAEGLVGAGHPPGTVHYVGTQRGIETTLVAASPFPHTFLDVVGLQRALTPRNLAFVPKLVVATTAARRLLRRLRPRVLVSVGGYGAMPSVFAARSLRIPIVVVSYDRRPGRANALAARLAAACAVAFPGSSLPRAHLTGAPVRQRVLDIDRRRDRAAARSQLGIDDDRFMVTVTGGSLGSGVLNQAVSSYVRAHGSDRALAVRHVVGHRFAATSFGGSTDAGGVPGDGVVYQVVAFDEALAVSLAATDLLVGRGGASTVAEVATAGVPAILVPWAAAAENHQRDNVRWLADRGGAVLLPEHDVARLGDVIEQLRHDPARLAVMEAAAGAAGELHRRRALPALIELVALP